MELCYRLDLEVISLVNDLFLIDLIKLIDNFLVEILK